MTIHEVSEGYGIPMEILREYEGWGLKQSKGPGQYGHGDLEQLSLMMTLYDIGFTDDEVKFYLGLQLKGEATESMRLQILDQKRAAALDAIHCREKQLDRLDYLRHELRRKTRQTKFLG